jgi:hypothetical protein
MQQLLHCLVGLLKNDGFSLVVLPAEQQLLLRAWWQLGADLPALCDVTKHTYRCPLSTRFEWLVVWIQMSALRIQFEVHVAQNLPACRLSYGL